MQFCLIFFLLVSGGLAERKEGGQAARGNNNLKVQNVHQRASPESEARKPKGPPKSYSDDESGVKVPFEQVVKVERPYPVFVPQPYPVYIERKVPFVVKVTVPQAFSPETYAKSLNPGAFTKALNPEDFSSGSLQQGSFQAKKVQYSLGENAPAAMKMQEENPIETAEFQRSSVVFSENPNLFELKKPFEEKEDKKVFQQYLREDKPEAAPSLGLTYWRTKNARPQNGRPQKAVSYSFRQESGTTLRRAPEVREDTGENPVEVDWSQMGRAQEVKEAMEEGMAQRSMKEAMARKEMQDVMAQKSMEAMTQAITHKVMPEAMSQKMQQAMAPQTMQEDMAPPEMAQNGVAEDQEYGAMEQLEGQKEGGNVFNDDAEVVSTIVKVIDPNEKKGRKRAASYTHSSYTAIGKLVGFTTTVQHHPE